MFYDCVIIGGGPAGLNAALVLGRARRKVALFDANQPRNAVTHASHGYLTQDGVTPAEFRRIAYEEVLNYPTVEHYNDVVTEVKKIEKSFLITTDQGQFQSRKVLVATGLKEVLPDINGIKEHYGKSIYSCPYCDGWELRDRPLIVVSDQPRVYHLAKLLYNWSHDLIVCTNGKSILNEEEKQKIIAKNIIVTEQVVERFHGNDGHLAEVQFTDGTWLKRTGSFITPKWFPQLDFLNNIDYEKNDNDAIQTDVMGKSSIPGLFAAGEATTGTSTQLIIAAASGSIVAASINLELTEGQFTF
ncbi:NAD(P)/FAD-dependent oxidoreductase [Bacillus solimangrovi]|uniref:Pyridine nucleotide-disulfide oxidoreductase n=1 Tax=Bacillus solimangrovi TaxID=1305675 RepID=A0A1E5LK11_9BACI|nr:NAD(P)/FAD-dependent oxidoreductase [Bacillus solimangrovi]OEH94439.1 pyridine nucleotide-disulfide oxidoreductase [Bacillus solimangrovi]